MARRSLKEVRQRVKEKAPGGNFESEFWTPMDNLDIGSSATLRFLPYDDSISGGFWTIQKMLTAFFTNPENDEEEWMVKIPCLEMFELPGEVSCPVTNEVRALFKEADSLVEDGMKEDGEAVKQAALKHWIRYSYMLQGFVLNGGNKPISDTQITAFRVPKSMYKIIYDSIMDEEHGFDELPCGEFDMDAVEAITKGTIEDYIEREGMTEEEFLRMFTGREFIAKKTKNNKGFNNYESSKWNIKEHDLTDEQINAVAENGLIDLRKFLPKRPTEEQYEVYTEMMKISLGAAMGNEDNTWNPEWEEVHGIKPIKPKSDNSGGSSSGSSGGGLRDTLASRRSDKSSGEGNEKGSASSVRDRLNKNRGVSSGEDATKSSDDDSGTSEDTSDTKTDDTATGTSETSSKTSSLAERLRAKKQAAKEAAAE